MLSEDILGLNKHGACPNPYSDLCTIETMEQNDLLASLEAAGAYLNDTAVPLGLFPTNGTLGKRQASCDSTYGIVTDATQRFVDRDVQMSPVVCAVGDMDINAMKGSFDGSYSDIVANSVTVSGGGSPTLIADKLTAQFGSSFSRTWTTQDSITTKGTVKDGNFGVMITRPLVTRRYGRTMQGCPASYKQIGTWMADEHGEGSYAGIDWVSGAISMCTKKQTAPPLTRCQGAGKFVLRG
ncbi:hypothetical protein E4T52_03831 [Aureobasidium sp. EXF-3400]|nr:hypothetical protein E4T51_02166 [Aureobasidium sp. EXF-12344]KAI4781210.1 hypothetical protein E4T52_03831 [Aureobasidium sp. EXF-3400]